MLYNAFINHNWYTFKFIKAQINTFLMNSVISVSCKNSDNLHKCTMYIIHTLQFSHIRLIIIASNPLKYHFKIMENNYLTNLGF